MYDIIPAMTNNPPITENCEGISLNIATARMDAKIGSNNFAIEINEAFS